MYENLKGNSIFISAGNFDSYGGWALDTQFIPNIGSSYLLAHGLGKKVDDAVTRVEIEKKGKYRLWALTRDWVADWKQNCAPGVFKVGINGRLSCELGNKGKNWAWQDAGTFELEAGGTEITLVDLTGFEGRCAALFLTMESGFEPPAEKTAFIEFRKIMCGMCEPTDAGSFDMAVAGGGIAGMCAAVSAAQNGLKVALVQDRFVFGGNNSSEVRVWLGGGIKYKPFEKIGDIVATFEPERHAHYGHTNTGDLYEDDKRAAILASVPGLTLFTGQAVTGALLGDDGRIKKLIMTDVRDFTEKFIGADLFTDATGDSTLGYAAGADCEITTNGHMGITNVWHVKDTGEKTQFPRCPWAIDLTNCKFPGRYAESDESAEKQLGGWYWESGFEHDPIQKAEYARDTNFRAMYGAFDALKNVDGALQTYKLGYADYIGGKRESRRLLGDVVLTKSEIISGKKFDDACVPCTWKVDVHYPKREYYPSFHEGDAFLSTAYYENCPTESAPFFMPYRCLYSRNVKNLFMAGRNISTSHDALGTARVMRTTGMMGEIVGIAAGLCKKYGADPRDIYEKYLDEFISLLK